MVKFGKQFLAQQESQYDGRYLRYKELKRMLKDYKSIQQRRLSLDDLAERGSLNCADPLLLSEVGDIETQFRCALDEDILTVRRVLRIHHRSLWTLVQNVVEQAAGILQVEAATGRDVFLEPVRSSLTHISKSLVSLQSYVIINYIALSKILKKHDKNCHPFPPIKADMLACTKVQELVHSAGVSVDASGAIVSARASGTLMDPSQPRSQILPSLDRLIETVELLYADLFENGSVPRARIALLSRQTTHTRNTMEAYRVGVQMGLVLCLLLLLGVLIFIDSDHWAETNNGMLRFKDTLPVFSCFALIILVVWMWACNVYVWRKARVNFVFLLELNPRTRLVTTQLFDVASRLSVIYLAIYCCYVARISNRCDFWGLPEAVFPMSLTIFFLLKMLWPFDFPFGFWDTRRWVMKTVFQIVISPFHQVRFQHVYVADVICSLVTMLGYLQYTLCYYTTGQFSVPTDSAAFTPLVCRRLWGNVVPALVTVLPLWWRFCQCLRRYKDTGKRFPNLANALKYALTQVVSLFGAFHPDVKSDDHWGPPRVVWMVFIVASTLYTFLWDVLQDWSLFQKNVTPRFLRKELMYSRAWLYYAAIPTDFALRFVFVITIIPYSNNPLWSLDRGDFVGLILPLFFSILEVFRRCMWGMFRLESEHVNNKEGFREITPIPKLSDEPEPLINLSAFKGPTKLWMELLIATVVLVSVSVGCYFVMQT